MTVDDLIKELQKMQDEHGEHCEVFMVNGRDKEFIPRRVESVEFKVEFWEYDGEYFPNDCIKLIPDF